MSQSAVNTGHPSGNWYLEGLSLPDYPALTTDLTCDVAIIGGGFTGLGAALELARKGFDVVLLEGARIGSGASGRNGGQIHIGQRLDPETLHAQLGPDAARELWHMAMDARANLEDLTDLIDCDTRPGLIHAWHRPRFEADDRAYAAFVEHHYGYDALRVMTRDEVNAELGTTAYHGGLFDARGGHLHPLKLALGMARLAHEAGARLYENSRVDALTPLPDGVSLRVGQAKVEARRVLICGNGYMSGLDEHIDTRVMPINNFIAVTEPLDSDILSSGAAAADSRFVVNYWRRTPDGRLLFGGGENYVPWFPDDIKAMVRTNLLKIYPGLKDTKITHAWGGTLAITLTRAPFVRRLNPHTFVSAGYSGQGVVLAPFFGNLLARAVAGDERDLERLSCLPVPPLPGGKWLRWPLQVAGLSYYALRDRL